MPRYYAASLAATPAGIGLRNRAPFFFALFEAAFKYDLDGIATQLS